MPVSRPIKRRAFLSATALAAAAVVAPASPAASAVVPASPAAARFRLPRISTAFELPGDRVYPEGIAADPRTGAVYVGSYTTGAVYRAAPGRSRAEVFLPAGTDGRSTANGLKVDRAGRLWVIDSTSGVDVYDVRTRALLARFEVPEGESRFINDLAIADDGTAYLTDSVRPLVYAVTPADLAGALGRRARLVPRYDLSGVVPPAPAPAFTLNGIAISGRWLFTVDMTGGGLYRVDLATGAVRQVDLHGGDLVDGDGLELVHGTLWAAHNRSNTISRWRLSAQGASARLEHRITSDDLQIPTTLVHERGRLLVVRSQFDKGGPMGQGTPRTPFTVARVTGI